MTKETFEADDRFAVLTSSDLEMHGHGRRDATAAAGWWLDPENSESFEAVLDPADNQVATLDANGEVVWEPLAEFSA